jgi:TolA-binding protein/uncharacterized protein YdhG (YjbR/CyaY superfamily)
VANLRGRLQQVAAGRTGGGRQGKGAQQQGAPSAPVLSDAEIARREKVFADAYAIFQPLRKAHPRKAVARLSREEIMVMVDHWRSIGRWQRAAELAGKYLADNPADAQRPQVALAIARDYLAWAATPPQQKGSTQERLAEVASRFAEAREALRGIVRDFPDRKGIVHEAQWDIANSFITQARVVDRFSATLARGQYVRGARELLQLARTYHDHPKIAQVPQMLWDISQRLAERRYFDEAVEIWHALTIEYPTHQIARQAALRTAQTYEINLKRPLLAAEAYHELYYTLGGTDGSVQNAIYQIGVRLKNEKRWVEALHVLETFADSFPRHAHAGEALTMVGQIHQANEAWQEAIAAYRRVIEEFAEGDWVRDARWAIVDCTINLSRWRDAIDACEGYIKAYPKDKRLAEASRRIGILKDLARYQAVVDQEDHRKAFDAQYQIAEIIRTELSNPVKAIIEYRKVPARWPDSHLADDAMFDVGTTYLAMGETQKAREALLAVAAEYPTSPLADDALYRVGQSYEQEAQQLAAATRRGTIEKAQRRAQRDAYQQLTAGRNRLENTNAAAIAKLKAAGKKDAAELAEARGAFGYSQYNIAGAVVLAQKAEQEVQTLTARQLAARQDKISAALRQAVCSFRRAVRVPGADKADEALLQMATIYAERLKDADQAMKTYREIVRQFPGRAVAEDATWRIAKYHEDQGRHAEAIEAYEAFLRNYRRSARADDAQFAIAEGYEQLGEWVKAMDAYTNYISNFPSGPRVEKAKQQITWIKTYHL